MRKRENAKTAKKNPYGLKIIDGAHYAVKRINYVRRSTGKGKLESYLPTRKLISTIQTISP